jgi:dGTP triphosphohydrolase|tara:strand:+ start:193 stop:795 length:603 start_codon:yes stop_codon:yes gene_type:complete
MTQLSRQNWTRIARNVAKAQSKIANDLLDVAEAEGTGEVAGPQEVVDAIEVIVDQLEEVQAAIPAEASGEELGVEAPVEEAPVEEVAAPVEEEEEEEEEYVAKLKSQVAALTRKVTVQEKERIAQAYSELFDDIKVAQVKFDEVIHSPETVSSWQGKIAAIENYRNETKNNSSYAVAPTTSGFLSRSKVAKLKSDGLEHL